MPLMLLTLSMGYPVEKTLSQDGPREPGENSEKRNEIQKIRFLLMQEVRNGVPNEPTESLALQVVLEGPSN